MIREICFMLKFDLVVKSNAAKIVKEVQKKFFGKWERNIRILI